MEGVRGRIQSKRKIIFTVYRVPSGVSGFFVRQNPPNGIPPIFPAENHPLQARGARSTENLERISRQIVRWMVVFGGGYDIMEEKLCPVGCYIL
jgi:hypothetical protein